jgi:hypothetical protein
MQLQDWFYIVQLLYNHTWVVNIVHYKCGYLSFNKYVLGECCLIFFYLKSIFQINNLFVDVERELWCLAIFQLYRGDL